MDFFTTFPFFVFIFSEFWYFNLFIIRIELNVFLADRLQTTTVKTTWNHASTDPVTEIFRSSRQSHSVINGHAHAQVINFILKKKPMTIKKNVTQRLIELSVCIAFAGPFVCNTKFR